MDHWVHVQHYRSSVQGHIDEAFEDIFEILKQPRRPLPIWTPGPIQEPECPSLLKIS